VRVRQRGGAATAVIPTDDVERAIEGAQQLQREDGGFRAHCERALGAPPGKRVRGCDNNRKEDEVSNEV
jgi:hypothetical protein